MPLRDHFGPPVMKQASWEGFHGGWPMTIVQQLVTVLPDEFTAEPRVHLGTFFEIDVWAFEHRRSSGHAGQSSDADNGSVTTATWAPPRPTMTAEVELLDQYGYEVLVYDLSRARKLVAAIEIVSPANKDRPESRKVFVAKCATLLQQDVCVSIVDVVTVRHFNLYTELLEFLNLTDPALSDPPPIYAVTCRKRTANQQTGLDCWAYPLTIGRPLPSLPIWLTEDQGVTLDLEAAYEQTCRALRIA